jgi:hypothetical protein
MVSVEPINVAISPLHAALAFGKSVTSIASRPNEGRGHRTAVLADDGVQRGLGMPGPRKAIGVADRD